MMLDPHASAQTHDPLTPLEGRVLVDGRLLGVSHTGGVHRYARQIVEALGDRIELDVASPRRTGQVAGQLWEHFRLPKLAKPYDLLFCPANVAPTRLSANTRLVVTFHCVRYLRYPESYSPGFRAYFHWLIPRVLRRADAVLAVSESAANEFAEFFPYAAEKIHVTRSGVGEAFGLPETNQRQSAALFVGRAGPAKGLAHLLQAFERMGESTTSRLRIVGTTREAFLQANPSARDRVERLEPRLDWIGQINDPAEMARQYQTVRLFVSPTRYEALPLPPLEAMACGTPAVISDIPPHRENYAQGAQLVDQHSVQDLAAAMQAVLNNDQRFAQLESAGLALAKQFTWQRCAQRTIEVFQHVLMS